MPTHAIAKLYHYTKHLNLCNACRKCVKRFLVESFLPRALVGKNGDGCIQTLDWTTGLEYWTGLLVNHKKQFSSVN